MSKNCSIFADEKNYINTMANNRYYRLSYELHITEGDQQEPMLVEKTNKDNPFEFVTGLGFTLPDFEASVESLQTGDKFEFTIPKEKAYGEYDESRVKTLPKDIFHDDHGHFDIDSIYPGNVIPMVNEEGMQFEGLIKEVGADNVVVDFNHALAGADLHFRGEILDAHEATPQEITAFVNVMSGECSGCEGGSCDCGHCHK